MLQDPEANPYAQLAGKRVRGTEVVVELAGGHPAGIVRMVYFNAKCIFMRGRLFASPANTLYRCLLTLHKRARLQ